MSGRKPNSKPKAGVPKPAPRHRATADMPDSPLDGRWVAMVVGALIVAWLVLFLPQVAGRAFVLGDATFYRGYGDYSYERWTQLHERTLWNPYVFFGIASAASVADPRPQWLPDGLLTLWDALTRGPNAWLLGPPLLAHLAGMIGIAALARRLWRCGPTSMLIAGLVWGLAPNLVVPFALGHDAQAISVGLIPVLLLTADAALGAREGRTALAWSLALAMTLALMTLGGHPQFVVYGLILLLPFLWIRRREAASPARFGWVLGALGMGAAMSAALWWPAWLYLGDTIRGEARFSAGNARDFSLGFRDFLAIGWARAVGWGGAGYWGGQRATDYANTLGAIGFPLAVWGAVAGWKGARSGAVRGLVLIAAVASLLALGANLPVLGRFLLGLPLISSFRTPSTWMLLTQLAGALLAALGFRYLRSAAAEHAGAWRGVGLALLVVAGLLLAARSSLERAWSEAAMSAFRVRESAQILNNDENERTFARVLPEAAPLAVTDLLLRALVLGLFALAVTWKAGRGHSPVVVSAALVLALVDLGSVSVPETRRYTGPRSGLTPGPGPPFARAGARDPLHRVYPLDTELLFSNNWITWRARSVAGLHGAVPRRWSEVRRNNLLLWDGFVRAVAVRYVGGDQFTIQDTTRYERLAGGVMSRRDALPRAYAVPLVMSAPHDSIVVQRMARPEFDPSSVVYTTDDAAAGDYPGSAGARIEWRRDDPDVLELAVRADAPAFVVVADSWFAGWSATLDGRPVPIARVSHVLRGVPVPAGEHVLAMTYAAPGWSAARAVTLASWALWLIAALAILAFAWRSRESGAASARSA